MKSVERFLSSAALFVLLVFGLLALTSCEVRGSGESSIAANASPAQTLVGTIVKVIDGDTVKILVAGHEQVKIRISGIDTPEPRQSFGQAAKSNLIALTGQRDVIAFCANAKKKDRYGRLICRVEVAGVDVGLRQLQAGLAWHYKQYQREQPEAERQHYATAEIDACGARRGLWGDPAPIAPWDWRKASKVKDGPPAVTPAASYPCQR